MCGILGLVLHEGIIPDGGLAAMGVNGLTALQHRGTESSGIVGSNGLNNNHFEIVKGEGLVREVYSKENLSALQNAVALVGHNRYSTAGLKGAINCIQPFVVHTVTGLVAISHNGELVRTSLERRNMLESGVGLSTDTDSELIAQTIGKAIAMNKNFRNSAHPRGDIGEELMKTLPQLLLSYSLLVMTYDRIYAIRDRYGNRPLCVGMTYTRPLYSSVKHPYAYVAASESCAFFPINGELHFELKPGEIVEISRKGCKRVFQMPPENPGFCIFEYVYFANETTVFEGQQVYSVRKECGRLLARETRVQADIVSAVPESAIAAALGFAQESGIKYEPVLNRNSYIGRSFIQPNNHLRLAAVTRKFGVITENVFDKRIILVDDSVVRGNTMGIIVNLLKAHGAREVHVRIASPPIKFPCFMGINMPTKQELIASNHSIEEIKGKFGADSVKYLSISGLHDAVTKNLDKGNSMAGYCTACLTGQYPVEPQW